MSPAESKIYECVETIRIITRHREIFGVADPHDRPNPPANLAHLHRLLSDKDEQYLRSQGLAREAIKLRRQHRWLFFRAIDAPVNEFLRAAKIRVQAGDCTPTACAERIMVVFGYAAVLKAAALGLFVPPVRPRAQQLGRWALRGIAEVQRSLTPVVPIRVD